MLFYSSKQYCVNSASLFSTSPPSLSLCRACSRPFIIAQNACSHEKMKELGVFFIFLLNLLINSPTTQSGNLTHNYCYLNSHNYFCIMRILLVSNSFGNTCSKDLANKKKSFHYNERGLGVI